MSIGIQSIPWLFRGIFYDPCNLIGWFRLSAIVAMAGE
jgi:hypothetical protein